MTPKIREQKQHIDEYGTDEVPPEQRAAIQDSYGCIKWDLKFLPLGKTPEIQEEKKEKLKMMSQQTDANLEESGRFGSTNLNGMTVHFKELTGIGLLETFTWNVGLKGK
ncbi:hypothetical protein QTP70_014316 [Hemibagrus guttatus]|uniref:Uncharacterized protein n=1 Tax=Hemibagrus guttatus TaxID=175788 RepID=A0AAE0QUX2_9TELE|nr:hypothetical protein QTP70_014316 [Hemibagrus guttatus]KAK3562355.1 hypothetical protein QTP86_033439 [Hemibagrus guttatus]